MKGFLGDHWEKLVLGVALLLAGVSALFNLVLPPPEPDVVARARDAFGTLEQMRSKAQPKAFPAVQTAARLQERLAQAPETFPVQKGLISYSGSHAQRTVTLVAGDPATDIPVEAAFNRVDCVSPAIDVLQVEGEQALRVTPKQPGEALIKLFTNQRLEMTVRIQVKARTRIELWPPKLTRIAANPQRPGEISLAWEDDPRTSGQVIAGYLLERRRLPDGAFENVLGAGNRMLPAGTLSYVDTAEANRRYEYRVRTVGDGRVTNVMGGAP